MMDVTLYCGCTSLIYEAIDQGLDGIEGKDQNEEIRTMALMEFMKLMGPTQLMGE